MSPLGKRSLLASAHHGWAVFFTIGLALAKTGSNGYLNIYLLLVAFLSIILTTWTMPHLCLLRCSANEFAVNLSDNPDVDQVGIRVSMLETLKPLRTSSRLHTYCKQY